MSEGSACTMDSSKQFHYGNCICDGSMKGEGFEEKSGATSKYDIEFHTGTWYTVFDVTLVMWRRKE